MMRAGGVGVQTGPKGEVAQNLPYSGVAPSLAGAANGYGSIPLAFAGQQAPAAAPVAAPAQAATPGRPVFGGAVAPGQAAPYGAAAAAAAAGAAARPNVQTPLGGVF
jgi:hypothetical protein